MKRTVVFRSSFDRLYKKLDVKDKLRVEKAIDHFLAAIEQGEIPKGLGLKRLKDDLWEIRVDMSLRVSFRMKRGIVEFGLVGDHEEIRKYLRNYK